MYMLVNWYSIRSMIAVESYKHLLYVSHQDKLFPQAIDYLQRAFRLRRRVGPVLLSRCVPMGVGS